MEYVIPFERRISFSIFDKIGASIEYFDLLDLERYPDATHVNILVDAFTTYNGSWEVPNIQPWARETYMLPWQVNRTLVNNCGYSIYEEAFWDAGADHNLFGRTNIWCNTFEQSTMPRRGLGLIEKLFVVKNPALDGGAATFRTKDKQLWGNLPMYGGNTYTYYPFGISDKIVNCRMPGNHHYSIFGVWIEVPVSVFLSWQKEPEYDSLSEMMMFEAEKELLIPINPDAALVKVASADGPFIATSAEFDKVWNGVVYRAQRFQTYAGETRIYYCPVGHWDVINWVPGINAPEYNPNG